MQIMHSTRQSGIIRRMKADAVVQETEGELKSSFSCQVADNENSSEDNLIVNVWARRSGVD